MTFMTNIPPDSLLINYTSFPISFPKNRDRLHFWQEEHPAASKGFAFASLLAQASIASRVKSGVWWLVISDWWMGKN